jgi:hypothetical protein
MTRWSSGKGNETPSNPTGSDRPIHVLNEPTQPLPVSVETPSLQPPSSESLAVDPSAQDAGSAGNSSSAGALSPESPSPVSLSLESSASDSDGSARSSGTASGAAASRAESDGTPDVRLYVTEAADWMAHVKVGSEKIYCYQRNPGEDYFHLIVAGEVYLQSVSEKLCLRCALRRGVVTLDRLYWQHRVKRRTHPVV